MGFYRSCYSSSVGTNSVEIGVVEVYDEVSARSTSPGFDDILGQPFLEDTDQDQIGERVRPTIEYRVRCKIMFSKGKEQRQSPTGNAPLTDLQLTLYEDDLKSLGLIANGIIGLGDNDRLVRIENGSGEVRWDFTYGGRDGLFFYDIMPGETGSGILIARLEKRNIVAKG